MNNIDSNYPFDLCTQKRAENPILWIKAPFILPEWLKLYNEQFGITSFKITGRTHPINSILKTIEMYLSQKTDSLMSIEELWGYGLPGNKLRNPIFIPAKKIADSQYLYGVFLFGGCGKAICGEECNVCHIFLEGLLKKRWTKP